MVSVLINGQHAVYADDNADQNVEYYGHGAQQPPISTSLELHRLLKYWKTLTFCNELK